MSKEKIIIQAEQLVDLMVGANVLTYEAYSKASHNGYAVTREDWDNIVRIASGRSLIVSSRVAEHMREIKAMCIDSRDNSIPNKRLIP